MRHKNSLLRDRKDVDRPTTDPVSRAIANAPVDEEPLTAEEEKALDEASGWAKRNPSIPHEKVLKELGIKPTEIKRSKPSK